MPEHIPVSPDRSKRERAVDWIWRISLLTLLLELTESLIQLLRAIF